MRSKDASLIRKLTYFATLVAASLLPGSADAKLSPLDGPGKDHRPVAEKSVDPKVNCIAPKQLKASFYDYFQYYDHELRKLFSDRPFQSTPSHIIWKLLDEQRKNK